MAFIIIYLIAQARTLALARGELYTMKSFDKYTTQQLQTCLRVLTNQSIQGYNQQQANEIEKHFKKEKDSFLKLP